MTRRSVVHGRVQGVGFRISLRETAAMGVILAVHLGVVLGLFLAMPYGKFVHGIYRFGALLRFAKEERKS